MKKNYYSDKKPKGLWMTLLTLFCCLFANMAMAQDIFTWNGPVNGDWANVSNWTKSGSAGTDTYPGETPARQLDLVVINNGGTPVVASGTYGMLSLAISNASGGDTGSTLIINSGATITVSNSGVNAIALNGGSIVNNGTLNVISTNVGASFGIVCGAPTTPLGSATEYGYSGIGALNINTSLGSATSGGIQFTGTAANTTYKMLFNGATTFNLKNTNLAVYALRVENGAKGPVIIGGTGFELGTSLAPVNYGLLTMGNNGNNVTVNTGTTLTLNSAATNTAQGISIAQGGTTAANDSFTNKGTINILGAITRNGINLTVDNATQAAGTNKIIFENQGTINVEVVCISSTNNAPLSVSGVGTGSPTAGSVTITNTATGILNLKNNRSFSAVSGRPISIFNNANNPSVAISNAGTLTFTGENINFGGLATKSSITNTGTIISSNDFQNFTITNNTTGTITFTSNTGTTRSAVFTVAATTATNAIAGDTYADAAGNVYTVVFSKATANTTITTSFPLTGTPTPGTASTSLTRQTGTGPATIAYTGTVTVTSANTTAALSTSPTTNNGLINTGTASNLNTIAGVLTTATSVIDPGGASGKGITDFLKASAVVVLGKLKLQISGTGTTNYDRITNSIAGGGFDITDAVLDVTGIYTPLVNTTFDILTTNASGTLTGNFSSSNVIGLTPGWSVAYTNGTGGKVQLVYSTANTWTGATSTDWATATNWSNGGVPISTSDVTIADVANKPVIDSNVSVNTLTLNASASLTVNSGFNLTVTGAIANSGAMTIESNANLIQGGTTNTNTGNVIVKRNSNPLYILDYTMWSSPVSGTQTLADFSPMTSTDPIIRFYTYDPANNWYKYAVPTSTFTTGTGYLIRMPKEGDATYIDGTAPLTHNGQFTGIPNNGTITLSGLAADKFHSVGNPYPSTISANTFISGNSTGGTLYFWRKRNAQAGSAYATYNSFGGTASGNGSAVAPNGTIQVGQGFIVKTGVAATSLAFTNAMRVANNDNQFFKTKQVQKDRVWVNLTRPARPATNKDEIDIPEAFSQALIGYMDGATLGVDEGIDGKYINDSKVALTSSINNEEYTIQGRPTFDPADVVALNFKTDADGAYTIALDHFDGVFAAGQDVYLVDSKTGTETDLKAGAYTFNATKGIDNTRFSLKYQKTLKVDAPAFNENSVSVYKNNGALYVNSGFVAMSNIKIFDIQGRLIAEQKNLKSTTAVFNSLRAKNQVLIVKITGENNNVVSKKIVN
jgi:hypothetical protein